MQAALFRCTLLLALMASVSRAEDFDRALGAYRAYLKRPSLHKRTLGRERLAMTEDLRALKILADSYGRPEKPKDQVRYLIVNLAAEFFGEPEHVAVFREWRLRHTKTRDAWLWYQALVPQFLAEGPDDLLPIAKTQKNACLRAAAIEALRVKDHDALLKLVPEVAANLPQKPVARAVIIESLGSVLYSQREKKAEPEFYEPAKIVIGLMNRPKTLDRTRIVLSRYFSRIFGVKFAWRDGRRWMAELEYLHRGGKQGKLEGYARPTFAGIEATGDRIVYVIDMSDSMLTPLSPKELEDLPKGPVSGTTMKPPRKLEESQKEAWKRALKLVKWKKVKNRFDAAREMLKTSLLMLDQEKRYTVIGFGDKAGTFRTTRGLTKATLGNIKKTIRELDTTHPGPKAKDRPHGTLRGKTNLHGGIHRAFKLSGKGMVGPYEYVNAKTWTYGCDTIFILSDGAPTWDDWPNDDRRDPEDRAGDPELGARYADADTLHFPGPYRRSGFLIEDVQRLNLFRKVEIHCVGMGEANMNLLRSLATIGRGEAIHIRGK